MHECNHLLTCIPSRRMHHVRCHLAIGAFRSLQSSLPALNSQTGDSHTGKDMKVPGGLTYHESPGIVQFCRWFLFQCRLLNAVKEAL